MRVLPEVQVGLWPEPLKKAEVHSLVKAYELAIGACGDEVIYQKTSFERGLQYLEWATGVKGFFAKCMKPPQTEAARVEVSGGREE